MRRHGMCSRRDPLTIMSDNGLGVLERNGIKEENKEGAESKWRWRVDALALVFLLLEAILTMGSSKGKVG